MNEKPIVVLQIVVSMLLLLTVSSAFADFKVAAFGDSLMAGYDLPEGDGFVPQLQKVLQIKGWEVEVLNLAISGETTADGLNRIEQIIRAEPDLVLLGLGSNDALRNLQPQQAYANLKSIITKLHKQDVLVLLLGAQAPLNWGMRYKQDFDTIFPRLAQENELELYPFILDGVALDPRYVLDDGLHPNAQGIAIMAQRIEPYVSDLLGRLEN